MKDFFEFTLPLGANYLMTTVRLTVGGLASVCGLDVDDGEDFKVCVTESLLLLKRNGYCVATARFEETEQGIEMHLTASGKGKVDGEAKLEDEISFSLLGALVDEALFVRDADNRICGVTLKKTV